MFSCFFVICIYKLMINQFVSMYELIKSNKNEYLKNQTNDSLILARKETCSEAELNSNTADTLSNYNLLGWCLEMRNV